MSKLTVTATTDLSTLSAAARKSITTAYRALADMEPTVTRIRRAAHAVATLKGLGLSVRGIVAIMAVEGNGNMPTGKGTIERLGYVSDAILGDWAEDMGDAADAILMSLYRISQANGAAEHVKRAAAAGRAAKTPDAALAAVDAVRDGLNRAALAAATARPARPVAGEASDGGKSTTPADTDTDDDTPAEHAAPKRAEAATLASASVLALIAELTRRASVLSFTPDAVLTEAFDALAAQWEMSAATVTA